MQKLVAVGLVALVTCCGGRASDEGKNGSRATARSVGEEPGDKLAAPGENGEKVDDGRELGADDTGSSAGGAAVIGDPSDPVGAGPGDPVGSAEPPVEPPPVPCAVDQLVDQQELQRRMAMLYLGPDYTDLPDVLTSLSADDPQSLVRAAENLMSDSATREGFLAHLTHWLELDTSPVALDASGSPINFQKTTRLMLLGWVYDQKKHLGGLFGGADALVDDAIAAEYGLNGPLPGDFAWVNLPAERSGGVLTQLHWLRVHPSASARGAALMRLLGTEIPSPPAGIDIGPPKLEPGMSSRAWLQGHQQDPVCAGCHSLIDPLGFAFENFDRSGQFRTVDGGKPVDASGSFTPGPTSGLGYYPSFSDLEGMLKLFYAAAPSKLHTSFLRSVANWVQAPPGPREECLEADALRLSTTGSMLELYAQLPTTTLFRSQ